MALGIPHTSAGPSLPGTFNSSPSALQVNDYQIKLRGMTRRMMATVSELSMYQAHSIKLSADKEALEGVVLAASNKLEVRYRS